MQCGMSLCTLLDLNMLLNTSMYSTLRRTWICVRSLLVWWCLLLGPCTWEPGRGVPGCRGGSCPCCCLLVFGETSVGTVLSYVSLFSPAQWAPPQLNGPVQCLVFGLRHSTDQAILAIRQSQEKRIIGYFFYMWPFFGARRCSIDRPAQAFVNAAAQQVATVDVRI